ncbi:hypothetical protein EVC45_38415 [Paraburkholderia sp. UYCP14C]|nr:hypothetical protein EVC45_38415 [Paraburkholderia sp. UYCP14C]
MRSAVHRFPYTRSQRLRRTCDVTLNVARFDSGVFAYEAWVHHAGIFKGNGLVFPLTSGNADDAAAEARSRIESDIE